MEPIRANEAYCVQIVEEPASKSLRFRYECEGRSAGCLTGARSCPGTKTWPTIKIQPKGSPVNPAQQKLRAICVVSCVTTTEPYRPHPHNLVGREGCRKGVCTTELEINKDCEFTNLGIQCVKKKDIEDSLKIRASIRVDPFKTGFAHSTQHQSSAIDLNSVRLCFQVFLEGPETGEFNVALKPVVSQPIYDKKSLSDLAILKLSDNSSPVVGNKEIILLCDKITKDDIQIRFYEEDADGNIIWESTGDFNPGTDVHKQYAISFRTPQYRDLEITHSKLVQIQLICPSKSTQSLPRPFQYLPLISGRKRLWNLTSYSKSSGLGQMLVSSDSAIAEENGVKTRKLEDLLSGPNEGIYRELNCIGTGFNEPVELEFDFSGSNLVDSKDVEPAPLQSLNAADLNANQNLELGACAEAAIDLNACEGTTDGYDPVNTNAVYPEQGDADSIYTSFMLAMRNPLAIPPPRPPKLTSDVMVIPDAEEPPPILPPRRKKQAAATGSHSPSKDPGQPRFLAKLFGGGNKKSREPDTNANANMALNLNNQQQRGQTSGIPPHRQITATSGQGQIQMNPSPAPTLPSPTTLLLQNLIAQEQMESGNGGSNTCAMDLTEAENYALYVDTVAPLAKLGSEFDESSCFYGEIGGMDVIGANLNESVADCANNN